MSDGTISQDEIDALLSGVDMGGISSPKGSDSGDIDTATLSKLTGGLKDKLVSNINTMTGASFAAEEPVVESCNRDQLLAKLPEMVVAVMNDYNTALKGDHIYLLAPEFAQKIAGLINKEDNPDLDDMTLSVVSEFVNSHTGSEITDLSADGKLPGLAANPAEAVHVPKAMVRIPQATFALFSYPLTLDGQAYTLWEAVSSEVAQGMAQALGGGAPAAQAASGGALNAADLGNLMGNAQPAMGMGGMNMGMGMQQPAMGMGGMNMGMGMQQPMMGMQQPMMNMGGMNMGQMPGVQNVQFPNLSGGVPSGEQGNIGLIMDVFMEMTVELGRTKKQIKEILGMGEGTIIELDKLAGEPVDILVNHKPIAKGEVVVIDENFGVRVTEILSPMERVSDLH